jgi:3-hydroxypropanoate dehydrogenase
MSHTPENTDHPPVRGPLHRATVDANGQNLLFRDARSQNAWRNIAVPDALIRELYDLFKIGPTSMNCCPARFVFVRTAESKARLAPALSPGNVQKVMTAPVVAIIGYDLAFFEKLPQLFPHKPVDGPFRADSQLATSTAFRNGTLQGAYLLLAARALGLDCAPMSGFNAALVEQAFFADSSVKANFLCGLGYGDPAAVFGRLPRLPFDQACRLS